MRLVWLVAALVAGCAAPAPAAEEPAVEPTQTMGAIAGVVVDETITPIAGATVRIASLSLQAETDEEGRFSFGDVEPGFYVVEANASRFLAVQQSVDVQAGSVAKLRIALAADPRPEPFHETFAFQGQILFHATVVWAQAEWMLDTYAGISTPACSCVFTFESSGLPDGHVFEAVWTDSIADPRGPNENYWSYAVPDPYQELFGYAPSPIYRTWEVDAFEEPTGEYKVMLLGDEDGVAVQQDFEIFLTHWYHTTVPDGWSVVESS